MICDKIRVLHVFSIMNRGGAETLIMDVFRKANKKVFKFDFVVHTTEEGFFDAEIRSLGGTIYRVPKYKVFNHIEYCKAWDEILQKNNSIDIIHGHVRSTANIYLKIAQKKDMIKISHSHSISNGKGLNALIKNLYQMRIRKLADYYLAPSIDAGKWLFGKKIIEQSNFMLLKNGIDIKKYKYNHAVRIEYRAKYNLKDSFVIGHVGNFKETKNHSFLIKVFKQVKEINSKAKLVLIGDGEEKKAMEELTSKLGVKKDVLFLGSRTDIGNLLQMMDIFVFPSIFEGLGMVAIESQAAGLKTIVSKGIPKEAFVSDLIESIDLTSSSKTWAKRILKNENYERKDKTQDLLNYGYDINQTVKSLENLYKQSTKSKE